MAPYAAPLKRYRYHRQEDDRTRRRRRGNGALRPRAALDGVKAIIFNRRDKFFANAEETVAKIRYNTDCEIHHSISTIATNCAEIDSSVI